MTDLKEGRIVERGLYRELVASHYYGLDQLKGEREEEGQHLDPLALYQRLNTTVEVPRPLAMRVAICGRWERTRRAWSTKVAIAADPRNNRGNRNDSALNPATSSCNAALDG